MSASVQRICNILLPSCSNWSNSKWLLSASSYSLSRNAHYSYLSNKPNGLILKINLASFTIQRGKKNRKNIEYDDSDEESGGENEIIGKGAEIKSSTVSSMRADLLLKIGLNVARNKIEMAFYENKIRLNSKKISKKSVQIHVGDEIDLIKGLSPTNSDFLVVGRVELLSARAKGEEAIEVRYRRSKALVIENYTDGDPWKPSDAANQS